MQHLIPKQLVFNSTRHTALFLLSELYQSIEQRLDTNLKEQFQNILATLLSNEPSQLNITLKDQDVAVIRLIKFYLEFNHIAERFHRIYLSKENHIIPKLMNDLASLRPQIKDEDFISTLQSTEIDLVFTAHPTEIYERKILKKYIQIHKNLKNLRDLNDFNERSPLTKERRGYLLSLWLAPDYGIKRPDPKDEAKLAQLIFQYSLWNGLTQFKKSFYDILKTNKLPLNANKNIFKFSSWMGGDRDGNPFVTAKVTTSIIRSFAKKSLNLYFREFKRLKEDLCFNIELNGQVISIEKTIDDLQNKLGHIIKNNYDLDLLHPTEIQMLTELKTVYESLKKYNAKFLADQRLKSIIDRLETFGLMGMTWDIRQESSYHDDIIQQIYQNNFAEMSEANRLDFIRKHIPDLFTKFENLKNPSAEVSDFIDTIKLIQKFGINMFPYYIISMTRSDSDLLLIQEIFNILNIKTKVVPLFETLEDLENSSTIINSFLKNAKPKDKKIHIMLGYSDSAKTGSRLSSVWNLYLAQRKLVQITSTQGYEAHFFHGRGGSIGRGGGPVQHAIASCPAEAINHGFRMTVQGEVIFDRFGFSTIAVQSMMTYALSLINYKFSNRKNPIELESYEAIFAKISEASKNKYRDLISKKDFFEYFEAVTPVNFMSDLNIGSRPSKRQSSKKSYRAIPWIFGWTQNRCLLPTWYGCGTALEFAVKEYGLETLKSLYDSFFLFRSTIDLIYMTYLKVQMDVFKKYDQTLAPNYDFFSNIEEEFKLLSKNLLQIVDPKKINHVNLEEKLYGRLEVLEYLHDLQIEKLKQNKENSDYLSEEDKNILLLTIQALASGMGNTG